MSASPDLFAFEDFPHQPLNFQVSRKRFFSSLLEYLHVSDLETTGVPAYNLSSLGMLPDEDLAQIVPEVLPECKISLKDGYVWGKMREKSQPTRLFPANSPALMVFNLFDRKNTLVDASRQLALEKRWEASYSFAYVRGLFLWLVLLKVCQPRNA
jgi:hypothetical protein